MGRGHRLLSLGRPGRSRLRQRILQLGGQLGEKDDLDSARAAFQQAIALKPDYAEALPVWR